MIGSLIGTAAQDLPSQWPVLAAPVIVGLVAAAVLFAVGEPADETEAWRRQAARIPNALERLTGVPGWAMAVIGTGLLVPVLSVVGFYTDVAWHIDFGRDKVIFTPPHTMIVVGLVLIALSAPMGIVFATATKAATGFRWGMWQVPWSILPLSISGFGGFVGFPLDDLWHASYGVDVTLWSPTHLMMVSAGGLSTISLWMVLRETGARPRQSGWARAIYVLLAAATLVRLSTFQAEFDLGLPQFQLLFQPVIIALAAATGLVAIRLILGPGGALVMAAGFLTLRAAIALLVGPVLGSTVARFPLYLTAALAVEAAAAVVGTERRVRFAVVAGAGVATVGLAGEWWWSHVWGHHPWPGVMLREAVVAVGLAAVGAAVLAAVAGAVIAGEPIRVPAPAIAAAAAAVAVSLAIPAPRRAAPVEGRVTLERRGDAAVVQLALRPDDAARDARWFEAVSWQGGGLRRAAMNRVAPGVYRSSEPLPVSGSWKTLVRLHRGDELMALAVYLPEDEEIGAPLVPAIDADRPFVADAKVMLRETKPGPMWTRLLVYGVLIAYVVMTAALVVVAARQIHRPRRPAFADR